MFSFLFKKTKNAFELLPKEYKKMLKTYKEANDSIFEMIYHLEIFLNKIGNKTIESMVQRFNKERIIEYNKTIQLVNEGKISLEDFIPAWFENLTSAIILLLEYSSFTLAKEGHGFASAELLQLIIGLVELLCVKTKNYKAFYYYSKIAIAFYELGDKVKRAEISEKYAKRALEYYKKIPNDLMNTINEIDTDKKLEIVHQLKEILKQNS